MTVALPWLALALLAVAIASAIGAVAARAMFVTVMHLVTAGVSVAAAVLVLQAGQGGLALALFAAAWAPVLLLAVTLLSARSARASRRGLPLFSLAGALGAAIAIWWPLVELASVAPTGIAHQFQGLAFWLAPVVFVAGAGCVGVLGYGERGALTRGPNA
ncbi:MAG: hypothetical protein JNL81_04020 [Hyphomonadaceae bacterium]|nr:hypothetical protein [Hyphomonadaceae bacterium]